MCIKIWDLATGQEHACCRGHTLKVTSVAFLDGQRLVSGSDDKTVRIWEAPTGREILTLRAIRAGVTSVAVSSDGRQIASVGWDGIVRIWDATPLEETPSTSLSR